MASSKSCRSVMFKDKMDSFQVAVEKLPKLFWAMEASEISALKFRGDWFQGININLQIRDLNIKVINFQAVIQLQTISHIGSSLTMTQPAFVLLPVLMKEKSSNILSEKGCRWSITPVPGPSTQVVLLSSFVVYTSSHRQSVRKRTVIPHW